MQQFIGLAVVVMAFTKGLGLQQSGIAAVTTIGFEILLECVILMNLLFKAFLAETREHPTDFAVETSKVFFKINLHLECSSFFPQIGPIILFLLIPSMNVSSITS